MKITDEQIRKAIEKARKSGDKEKIIWLRGLLLERQGRKLKEEGK